jgi:hypothetical protein
MMALVPPSPGPSVSVALLPPGWAEDQGRAPAPGHNSQKDLTENPLLHESRGDISVCRSYRRGARFGPAVDPLMCVDTRELLLSWMASGRPESPSHIYTAGSPGASHVVGGTIVGRGRPPRVRSRPGSAANFPPFLGGDSGHFARGSDWERTKSEDSASLSQWQLRQWSTSRETGPAARPTSALRYRTKDGTRLGPRAANGSANSSRQNQRLRQRTSARPSQLARSHPFPIGTRQTKPEDIVSRYYSMRDPM